MPHRCLHGPCSPCAATPLPATLEELSQTAVVTELGHDMETLALMGTQFDDVLITTRNSGALVSGGGGYAPLQTTHMPLRLSQRRVSVRVSPLPELRLIHCQGNPETRQPSALAAVDPHGQIHHRVQYVSDFDTSVAQSLPPVPAVALPAQPVRQTPENVISLPAVKQARDSWATLDAGQHLNDLIADRGTRRAQTLPYVGRENAWAVLPQVLQSFLGHLDNRRFSFARFVPAKGLLQADVGAFEQARWFGAVFLGSSRRGSFSLDLHQVHSLWVTASPQHWQLEIYDAQDQALAVLAADPLGNTSLWRDFLISLPRLNHSHSISR
ncbi:MAG: hypothetical protein N4A70_01290 [Pelagimonas sp.]|nr:hypothetical protein [Pelagimonas sp.]